MYTVVIFVVGYSLSFVGGFIVCALLCNDKTEDGE